MLNATIFSIVAVFGSPAAPEDPPPSQSSSSVDVQPVPPPPGSLAFTCQSDYACPLPAQCRGGYCVTSEAYLDDLYRGGRSRTIAGGVVLGTGAALGIVSAGLLAGAYTDGGYNRSMAEAGYSLSGWAIGALVTGTIVLTVGQVKLAKWRKLRNTTMSVWRLDSPFVIHF